MEYILEFRDESQLENVLEKMKKAKKAIMEACQALEEADSNTMNERGRYRDGMTRGNRGTSSYRRGRYRDEMDDMDMDRDMMDVRRSRYGY